LYLTGDKLKKTKTLDEIDSKIDYKSKDKDVESFFKERQDDQVGLLQESISDIKEMIVDRGTLHKEMMKNFSEVETFINNNMPELSGASTEAIKVRQDLYRELLKKKIEIQELRIEEKLNFWRDKALLKKELREHMKEFRDMESKTSMIDNILEG